MTATEHKRYDERVLEYVDEVHALHRARVILPGEGFGQGQHVGIHLRAAFEGIDHDDINRGEVHQAKHQQSYIAQHTAHTLGDIFVHTSTSRLDVSRTWNMVITPTIMKNTMALAWP